jgi:hypothetical protein
MGELCPILGKNHLLPLENEVCATFWLNVGTSLRGGDQARPKLNISRAGIGLPEIRVRNAG